MIFLLNIMRIIPILLYLLTWFSTVVSTCQVGSSYKLSSVGILNDVLQNNGITYFFHSDFDQQNIIFTQFEYPEFKETSWNLPGGGWFPSTAKPFVSNDHIIFQRTALGNGNYSRQGYFCFDRINGQHWTLQILESNVDGTTPSLQAGKLGTMCLFADTIHIYSSGYKYDSNGSTVNNHHISRVKVNLEGQSLDNQSYMISQAEDSIEFLVPLNSTTFDETIFVNGYYRKNGNTGKIFYHQSQGSNVPYTINIIEEISLDGQPIYQAPSRSQWKFNSLATEESYYLYGQIKGFTASTNNADDLVILKFNHTQDLLWSKVYFADQFQYQESSLVESPDGELVLTYATEGAYPSIFARLNKSNGEIIDQKGYPVYSPKISVNQDGSLTMMSNGYNDESGIRQPDFLLLNTDTNGELIQCEVEVSCLSGFDVSVEIEILPLTPVAGEEILGEIDFELFDELGNALPFCNTATFPEPSFNFPQTLCLNETTAPTDLKNQLANGYEWLLTHPDGTEQLFDNENPTDLSLDRKSVV